jgi:predicted transposase YdaD
MDKMAEIDDAKAEARAEGRAEGILIGEAKGETKGEYNRAIVIAKNMLRNGTAPEIVAETVELSLEEVRSLN